MENQEVTLNQYDLLIYLKGAVENLSKVQGKDESETLTIISSELKKISVVATFVAEQFDKTIENKAE